MGDANDWRSVVNGAFSWLALAESNTCMKAVENGNALLRI
jgi:hypothetical protein